MGLTEKVIDASTLSQNRRRRFNDSEIYQQIFDNIVEQAIAKGLISGLALMRLVSALMRVILRLPFAIYCWQSRYIRYWVIVIIIVM
jgi:hypothetical protein